MPRSGLAALHQPIPRPTKAEVAQNKAEIDSRSETTTMQKLMGLVKKGPDVAAAASTVGDPSLADPEPISAQRFDQQRSSQSASDACGASGESGRRDHQSESAERRSCSGGRLQRPRAVRRFEAAPVATELLHRQLRLIPMS